MDLVESRESTRADDILEKRFISNVLLDEARELDEFQRSLMISRGFTNSKFLDRRGFQVIDHNKLQYTHPIEMRFVDMNRRRSADGSRKKKKSHPVHNKPLFGMMNNILRRLQFEFTSKTKEMLLKNAENKF